MKELGKAAKRMLNAKRFGYACELWAYARGLASRTEFPSDLPSLMGTHLETPAMKH